MAKYDKVSREINDSLRKAKDDLINVNDKWKYRHSPQKLMKLNNVKFSLKDEKSNKKNYLDNNGETSPRSQYN